MIILRIKHIFGSFNIDQLSCFSFLYVITILLSIYLWFDIGLLITLVKYAFTDRLK